MKFAHVLLGGGILILAGASIAAPMTENRGALDTEISAETVGQASIVELSAQAGILSGGRLKVLIHSTASMNLAVEGVVGGSFFASTLSMPETFGLGVRTEWVLGSGPSHAWHLSPGVNGYFIPARPYPRPVDNFGDAIVAALTDIPTNVFLISPNLDLSWMLAADRHFAMVLGLKLGASFRLAGGRNKGDVLPDLGLYLGFRI